MVARRRTSSARVREAELQASTARTIARWDGLKRIVPWVAISAGAVFVAAQLAGESTSINLGLGVAFSVSAPAGLVKILWDRSQKRRLRARITALETANSDLIKEAHELRGERKVLREQLDLEE